jgi:dienelactone hydrolase
VPPSPPVIFTFRGGRAGAPAAAAPLLYGAAFLPDAARHGPGPYPTLVSVYGGPHVQRVKADWATTLDPRSQALRAEGYLVLVGDNRGSARRGLAFEAELHGRMGEVEVEDQVALVATAVGWGLADAARVGVYGWSYGGYMSLMCLAKEPGVFHAAVCGAPVTEWEGYDTGCVFRAARARHLPARCPHSISSPSFPSLFIAGTLSDTWAPPRATLRATRAAAC